MSEPIREDQSVDEIIAAARALPARDRALIAISELFVDTEQDELSLVSIAERLLGTGIDANELDRMFRDEVAPACANHAPIGVWPAFDLGDLKRRIEQHRSGWRKALPRVLRDHMRAKAASQAETQWQQVLQFVRDPPLLSKTAARLRDEKR